MNPQSAAIIAGPRNPLKSCFESKIQAKIFSKSTNPFAYSLPSQRTSLNSSFFSIPVKYVHGNQTSKFEIFFT